MKKLLYILILAGLLQSGTAFAQSYTGSQTNPQPRVVLNRQVVLNLQQIRIQVAKARVKKPILVNLYGNN